MRKKRKSYQYIANYFNVSRQNIWTIANNYKSPNKKINIDKVIFGGNKEKALFRDDYKCQICWTTEKKHQKLFKRSLCTHHLNQNKKNNTLKNLMTLCIQCHTKIHQNKGLL